MNIFFDIEVYPNFFVMVANDQEYTLNDVPTIKDLITKNRLIGFNCLNYDLPIVHKIVKGDLNTHDAIYHESKRIIENNIRHWQHDMPKYNVIDLIEPAPGVMTSLKIYGGRMHTPKMQDLPVDPDTSLTEEQKVLITKYCHNDVDITKRLFDTIKPALKLRQDISKAIKQDVLSKSDAQIAEAIFKSRLKSVTKPVNVPKIWTYDPPEFLDNSHLVGDITLSLSDKNAVNLPKELTSKVITIGDTNYKMGIGGLHSMESCASHQSDDNTVLRDFDVTSYYPSIIRQLELYPEHLGHEFLDVYSTIIDERVAAKKTDPTKASTLKITLNGSYGKFGSQYSFLFSPKLLTQVTLTGQLALLMLAQWFEDHGIKVVSANTDGIVVKHPKVLTHRCDKLVKEWEERTGFNMEETRYDALYSRDVNNYFAVKGTEIKGKGIFAPSSLMKNPAAQICYDAIKHNALTFLPVEDYIRNSRDVRGFLTVRKVKGGAIKDGELLGGVIRWYYSTSTDTAIHYATNGNKVPKSEGAMPLMDIDGFPDDIDYDWYINETRTIMASCNYTEEEW